jgi:formyltetrahydrofolate-dependent phosphoribosylglycinamide formyltransferase
MQAIIDAIANSSLNAEIAIVISNKKDAYILDRARSHNILAVHISGKDKSRDQFDRQVSEQLRALKVDLVVLIGYMRILSASFVHTWENRIINVHPSLLPEFAGGMDLNVHQCVIDARAKQTGCTVHLVDEGVDSGKILVQKRCDVLSTDTAETLKNRVQALEGLALIEAISNFSQNHYSL